MSEAVMLVDDDVNVLSGYKRHLRDQYNLTLAEGPQQALSLIASSPFAVVVSDLRMPGLSGIELLAQIRALQPECVRIMLTGNADLDSAIEAINAGSIFRFLTKPCPPEQLANAIEVGLEQYRLVTAERELLEKTLNGSIKLLSEMLALASPLAFGRAARVRRVVKQLAAQLRMESPWMFELAAMLSQIGCVAVPDDTLRKAVRGEPLTEAEAKLYFEHARIGQNLLANIPRLAEVARIVAYQQKDFDGGGYPLDAVSHQEIPLGARLLHLALDYDIVLATGRRGQTALTELKRAAHKYDPQLFKALQELLELEAGFAIKDLPVDELEPEMITAEDILALNGTLLCSRGMEITPTMIARFKNHADAGSIRRMVKVQIPLRR
jgi:response regulator RpfG family c-di-GMP phosphodiesterase